MPSNVAVVNLLITRPGNVPFSRPPRWRRQRRKRALQTHKEPIVLLNHGSWKSGSTTTAKGATCSNGTPAIWVQGANRHTYAKPAEGTTPWQIAHKLPEPWSPFSVAKWSAALVNHLDNAFVEALLHDITHGVELGYSGPTILQSYPNHLSALDASKLIIKELHRELNLNRMAGPFLSPPTRNFVGSPMGVVPKKRSNPLKYRDIHDLSWPWGHSVNDFIPAERNTREQAISLLKQAGHGAMMAKLDLSDAYRHILVRPEDWELLGSTWPIYVSGELTTGYFVNLFLPFGTHSAPAQFLCYADALNFIMHH